MKEGIATSSKKVKDTIKELNTEVAAMKIRQDDAHAILALAKVHEYEKANQKDVDEIWTILRTDVPSLQILNDIWARQEREFHLVAEEQNKQKLRITQLSNIQLSISNDSKQ